MDVTIEYWLRDRIKLIRDLPRLDLDVAVVLDKMPAGRAREPQSPPPEHNVTTTGGGERRPHAPQRRSLELERATSWRAMRRRAAVAREALQFFSALQVDEREPLFMRRARVPCSF